MATFRNYVVNEEEAPNKMNNKESQNKSAGRKKVRASLKSQLSSLDASIDKLMDDIENEIEKIDENPTFRFKVSQMLVNSEKEAAEFVIAIRSLINTLSRSANIIPDTRAHAEGVPGDDVEITKDRNQPKIVTNKELDKAVKKI